MELSALKFEPLPDDPAQAQVKAEFRHNGAEMDSNPDIVLHIQKIINEDPDDDLFFCGVLDPSDTDTLLSNPAIIIGPVYAPTPVKGFLGPFTPGKTNMILEATELSANLLYLQGLWDKTHATRKEILRELNKTLPSSATGDPENPAQNRYDMKFTHEPSGADSDTPVTLQIRQIADENGNVFFCGVIDPDGNGKALLPFYDIDFDTDASSLLGLPPNWMAGQHNTKGMIGPFDQEQMSLFKNIAAQTAIMQYCSANMETISEKRDEILDKLNKKLPRSVPFIAVAPELA